MPCAARVRGISALLMCLVRNSAITVSRLTSTQWCALLGSSAMTQVAQAASAHV